MDLLSSIPVLITTLLMCAMVGNLLISNLNIFSMIFNLFIFVLALFHVLIALFFLFLILLSPHVLTLFHFSIHPARLNQHRHFSLFHSFHSNILLHLLTIIEVLPCILFSVKFHIVCTGDQNCTNLFQIVFYMFLVWWYCYSLPVLEYHCFSWDFCQGSVYKFFFFFFLLYFS